MHQVKSSEDFKNLKEKAAGTLGLVVHYSASWCEPCQAVQSFLTKQSSIYEERVLFAEVDCEKLPEICQAESVESVPFISFFRAATLEGAHVLERVADTPGAKLDQIEQNLVSLFGEKGGKGVQKEDFTSLDEYLKYLTGRPGIILFITGSPSRPRCGFTSRLCELLFSLNAKFLYYDVMADNAVCEGLKTFSEWPTYPQVYVDGELIGGYDVCMQLHEEGSLKATLKLS